MNTTLDPVTGEPIVHNHLDTEEPDTNADPDGVEQRQEAAQQAKAPQLIPSYIEKDFEFRRGYKDQEVKTLIANGKRAYFLQPRVAAVETSIQMAQLALDSAYTRLDQSEIEAALALSGEIKDLDYTLGGLDQWLGDLVKRSIARQAASDAVFIGRGADMLNSWNATNDNATERKESFENVLFSAQKRLGVLLHALDAVDGRKFINLKAAAWQRMQSEARKNQEKYLHAEEYHATKSLNGDHAKEGARVSHSLLLTPKRAAA